MLINNKGYRFQGTDVDYVHDLYVTTNILPFRSIIHQDKLFMFLYIRQSWMTARITIIIRTPLFLIHTDPVNAKITRMHCNTRDSSQYSVTRNPILDLHFFIQF